jgi:hypothetical protein
MHYRTLLLLVASAPLFAVPALAVTVSNTGKTDIKLGIENNGAPKRSEELPAGKSVTFDCKSGCGLSGPWLGVEWAKDKQTFTTDGKTIDTKM